MTSWFQAPSRAFLVLLLLGLASTTSARAGSFLVENGQPRAQIVIAEKHPRKVRFAASELQTYVKKISGAELEIVTRPDGGMPVRIYVGRSSYTESLKISDEGLGNGAYRIKSGDGWLTLMGHDEDFVPTEPFARGSRDWASEKIHQWDKITGAWWRNPIGAGLYGDYNSELDLWCYDQGGSLNAVYGFLRSLGVRWYMPGELGEVVPKLATIELPRVDRTVHPDIAVRSMNFARFKYRDLDPILYELRLGLHREGPTWAHGIRNILVRPEQRKAHPEYYCLKDGRRDTSSRLVHGCLSSKGLFEENVRFVRTLFDLYGPRVVSVMPNDGLSKVCECPDCQMQVTPERGRDGMFSDYVWGYVNRVAAEVAKTHPEGRIICGAYSTYKLPPDRIEKLHPNVLVMLAPGRPRTEMDDESHRAFGDFRRRWLKKTDSKLMIGFYFPHTQRTEYRPGYFPHVMARGLRDAKDQVWCESAGLPQRGGLHEPGINHLNAWVLASLWWDVDQDIDESLDEYYELFYGPAAEHMKAFIEFCEAGFEELNRDADSVSKALSFFASAKGSVDPGTVYGKRIALADRFLETLRARSAQLATGRGKVSDLRIPRLDGNKWILEAEKLEIDGKLEEPFWARRRHLRNAVTRRRPEFATQFAALVDREAMYFGIHCEGTPSMPPPSISSTDDPAIRSGEHIEILIETAAHSYYQILVNPAGALADLDRACPEDSMFHWSSQAEVGVHVGDGFWSVEIRIPYTADDSDPLHLIVGRRPRLSMPWHFNLVRRRMQEGKCLEESAFSPVGEGSIHDVTKFGKLYEPGK